MVKKNVKHKNAKLTTLCGESRAHKTVCKKMNKETGMDLRV
jgi:hypothetical protein